MRNHRYPAVVLLACLALPAVISAAADKGLDKAGYAEAVKQEFRHAWENYKAYAWGRDELMPLSKTSHDWYADPLLMTPVDAFDTMALMGLDKERAEAKKLIMEKLSFDKDIYVQNFEVTIRLLGGLLSAYELDGDKGFLRLAAGLADRLIPVFDSPTGMPYGYVNLRTGKTRGNISNPAEIGTLILEFGTLSRLTGRPVYFEKAKRAMTALYDRRSPIGLVGTFINVETGQWTDRRSHIRGCIDSYYEYLLKGSILFGDRDLAKMWKEGIDAVNKYLADERYEGLWYGVADMDTGKIKETRFGALDCFLPAVLVLGGDIGRARLLQESCYKLWLHHGIEPEAIDYSDLSLVSPEYLLRPEQIESNYYLYKKTGDGKYLARAVTYLDSLVLNCRVGSGYASLKNVATKERLDEQPSYFLAETLKYLYLTFAPDKVLDLDKVIFNTEAHPLRRDFGTD